MASLSTSFVAQCEAWHANPSKQGTSFDFVGAGGEAVKSLVSKRSIVIAGHKTSVSLEDGKSLNWGAAGLLWFASAPITVALGS